MKLFNFVLAVTFASMPAVAAAKNNEYSKHGDAKSIFVANEDESLFKNFPKSMNDLEAHYLVGSSDKLSSYSKQENRKQYSEDSFQSKFESKDNHSKDNSVFGDHKFLTGNSTDHFSHGKDNDDRHHSSTVGFGEYCKKSDWDDHAWGGHHGWENNHESNTNNAPVPEPTSYALMLAGLLMLGLNKRRSN
jgi:hypothetical protein